MALENGFDTERLNRIDTWMDSYIDAGKYAGTSVLLARQGEIVHLSARGKRSVEDDLPFETDTITRIYSMTKMVTSIGLMTLVERGLATLDQPVSDFLPEFSTCQALIDGATGVDQVEPAPCPTLIQLLTHTSGLTYGFNVGTLPTHYADQKISFEPQADDLQTMTKRAAALPLAFQPGASWQYSIGIDIIGRVIEVISGQSLGAFLQTNIFDPLGMIDTGFSLPKNKIDRFADCYLKMDHDPLVRSDVAADSLYVEGSLNKMESGGGGLVSTLDDYFRFGEMVRLGGKIGGESGQDHIVSPRTLAYMRRNFLPGDIASMGPKSFAEMPMTGMGFGIGGAVVLDPALTRSVGSVGDFGWGGMASTYFWTDPVEDLTCVFFTQLIPSSSYSNRAELKALVHGALNE